MIKKFEQFEWTPQIALGGLLVGQLALHKILGYFKKRSLDKLNKDHSLEKISKLYGHWDVIDNTEIIELVRSKKGTDSGIIKISLDKKLKTVLIQSPTNEDKLKLSNSDFNKVLLDIYWVKDIMNNINECFSSIIDDGFIMSYEIDTKTGTVFITIYPTSGIRFGRHGRLKKLTDDEINLLSESIEKCESMFDCSSKCVYRLSDDIFQDRDFKFEELKLIDLDHRPLIYSVCISLIRN